MDNKINAGEFSDWIEEFTRTMKGSGGGSVPCGACVGCCTSSKFIHIRPTDKSALKAIPKEVMFQAPGLPKGYYLLGYNEIGHCPMFKTGKCSIYESRPETCRQYDCRVLAATNIRVTDESEEITKRVNSWEFEFSSDRSVELHNSVKLAGEFISTYVNEFPEGFVPQLNSQVALLAIRIHFIFLGHTMDSAQENARALVDAIVHECSSSK
jgi:uncharacterized protein